MNMKIIYLCIAFLFLVVPVSAELLEESYEGVNIYSHVNSSWDYSTRYEINTVLETEDSTSVSYTSVAFYYGEHLKTCRYYEHAKPLEITIDHDINNGLESVTCNSNIGVSPDFIAATSFHMMNGTESIGYGLMWLVPDVNDKLVYVITFDYVDDLSGIGTYTFDYADESAFDGLGYSQVYQEDIWKGSDTTSYRILSHGGGGGIYLRSNHYTRACHQSMPNYCQQSVTHVDEMVTTNIITNLFVCENDIYYHYDIDSLIGYVEIDNVQSGYKIGLTHDLYNSSNENNNDYYIYDADYRSTDQQHNNNRGLGVKVDLYTDSTSTLPGHTFILDYGGTPQTDSGRYGSGQGLSYINFNPDAFYSDNAQQYFDYFIHLEHAGYKYFVTSVILHPNYPGGIETYQNILNDTVSGNHVLVEDEFTFVPNVYCLRLYRIDDYPANVSEAYLIAESNPISITAEYEAPYQPPDQPSGPPNATSINQTLNNSWSQAYYDVVDDTSTAFFLPFYNLAVWLVLPVTDFSNNIQSYSNAMSDSFSESSSGISVLGSSVCAVFDAFPPKIVNMVTYFLILMVLILVMTKR